MTLVGIDPGTKTGFAVSYQGDLAMVMAKSHIHIYHHYFLPVVQGVAPVHVVIEDPSKRKWYGDGSSAKMQGVGSVKRDARIWAEICEFHDLSYELVHPVKGGTKWSSAFFKQATGYPHPTSQDGRDAACLILHKTKEEKQ